MPVISGSVAVAAGAVNDNLLQGSQYEFLPYDASLEFGLVADAAGAGMRLDVYSGQDVLMENGSVSVANRVPVYPDDFILTDVAQAGERIKIRARNTGGGSSTINYQVRVTPI